MRKVLLRTVPGRIPAVGGLRLIGFKRHSRTLSCQGELPSAEAHRATYRTRRSSNYQNTLPPPWRQQASDTEKRITYWKYNNAVSGSC